MKKWSVLLKTILVIILLLTAFWYLFCEGGPLSDTEIAHALNERIEYFVGAGQKNELEPEADNEQVVPQPVENEIQESEEVVDSSATIVFTGDVELSEYVQAKYDEKGLDGVISPELQQIMQDATVTMINNEFCFSTRGKPEADKQYTFEVNPSYVKLLNELGVDIAGLANNHCRDYGQDSLTDTFATLSEAGIEYTGAGNTLEDASKLIIKTDAMGRKYGFLAATRVIPFGSWYVENSQPGVFGCYDEANLLNAVKEARGQVDYLYVMVHWGVERTTSLENHQIQIGHDLIDAGVDAVIGMHSHCLQPVEYYNGKPIFYSLGNYIFNQTIKDGAAVSISYDEQGNEQVRIIPITASDAYTSQATGVDMINYIATMSDTVIIDEEGYISPR